MPKCIHAYLHTVQAFLPVALPKDDAFLPALLSVFILMHSYLPVSTPWVDGHVNVVSSTKTMTESSLESGLGPENQEGSLIQL